ncbi:MAG: DUF2085 domain-containing protein [Clostridia bacterium]|nr:DUF2085 domain-containing protein [Clostridia bacterium]MDO4356196.1 DUF2085 domain-containing protein [Clostridia bacterium]
MIDFLYRWLPRVFGCHCRSDRSFHFRGKRFPICARCTGECVGIMVAPLVNGIWHTSVFLCGILMLPMIIDGLLQLHTSYESTNFRRCITGMLFGICGTTLFVRSVLYVFSVGYEIGNQF